MSDLSERQEFHQRPVNAGLASKLKLITWILTGVVLLLVGLMRAPGMMISLPDGVDLSFLPPTHAVLNTIVSLLLIGAIIAVKAGKISLHKNLIFGALVVSVFFLLGYVAYHFTTPEIKFGDANGDGLVDELERFEVGIWRPIYLTILFTHIIAAAVSLPAILLTLTAALSNQFTKHKKMARWVFPVWLFVAISGPICYLMLRRFYP